MMVDTAPTTLRDMITLPPATMAIIQSAINSPAGGNLLFHGPGGTGKSAFCKVIAMEAMRHSGLVVPDYRTALSYGNLSVVNHVTGYNKAALEIVRQQARMHTLTATDRRWVIVEEFDSIGLANTNYVKTWLDELLELDMQVFASTNNLGEIDEAVRTRFADLYLGPHPNGPMRTWAAAELGRLGVGNVTDVVLSQLVNKAAGSVRALQRGCRLFAENGAVV
jgi:SpoVK/Ycf46/Vps4 family AAA+-type ATPase